MLRRKHVDIEIIHSPVDADFGDKAVDRAALSVKIPFFLPLRDLLKVEPFLESIIRDLNLKINFSFRSSFLSQPVYNFIVEFPIVGLNPGE